MSEKLSTSPDIRGSEWYESLGSVEFAGQRRDELQGDANVEGEHLEWEEKINRLRAPFEEDNRIKNLAIQRVQELRSEIADRSKRLQYITYIADVLLVLITHLIVSPLVRTVPFR